MTTHSSLGLTVAVSDLLDVAAWRESYAFNLALGPGAAPVEDELLDALRPGCAPQLTAQTLRGRETEIGEVSTATDELPDATIRTHLRAAASSAERIIGIPLGTVVVKGEPVDAGLVRGVDYDRSEARRTYVQSDAENFYRIDVPPGTISVERVRAYWRGQLVWSIAGPSTASSVLRLDRHHTRFHLIPAQGSLFALWPINDRPMITLMQTLLAGPSGIPDVWSVDYTIGPVAETGEVAEIEFDLAHWIRMSAALTLLPLASAGRTKGIAGASVDVDGLSQSVQLAGGGSRSIWMALEDAYRQAIADININRIAVNKRGLQIRGMGR